MRPSIAALCVACLGVLMLCSTDVLAETVALVTASPASEAAARYLSTQLDLPVVRRDTTNARHLDALVVEARAAWREDFVVVVDTELAVVSVLRPGDGTMGSRALAPTAAKAPYAVALAAGELLELIRSAPPARSAALTEPRPRSQERRLALDVGLVQSVSTNGDIALLQPTVGLDLEVSPAQSSVWLGAGLHLAGLTSMRRDEVLQLPDGSEDRGNLVYERDDAAARFSVGSGRGLGAVVGWCDLGLALINLRSQTAAPETNFADRRSAFWLGLGGELRFSFGAGFSVGVGAGGAWFPVTSRFYASPPSSKTPIVALDEGGLEFRARAALVWEFFP